MKIQDLPIRLVINHNRSDGPRPKDLVKAKKRIWNRNYYIRNRQHLIAVAAKWNKENRERYNNRRRRM